MLVTMKVLNSYGTTKKENGVENVRNSKVSQEEDKLIQQKLQEAFGYTDEQLAAQLDQAAAEYAAHPELNLTPPKGEFEKILAMAAQDETQDKKEDAHKVICLKKVMKQMILVATVGAILLGTGMMASGRRYYKFWGENRGKGEIVFNNVEVLNKVDSLERAYEEIEEQNGVEIPKLYYQPPKLKFKQLIIEDGMARIDFSFDGSYLYYQQMTKGKANSVAYTSDREPYKVIYNRFLDMDMQIYKNIIDQRKIEFSVQYSIEDTFYSLIGTINEDDFDKIVKNLSYFE